MNVKAQDGVVCWHQDRLTFFGGGSLGQKNQPVALGHPLLISIYHMIAEKKEYEELGGDYLDHFNRQGKETRPVRQLEKLGFEVSLTPTA